MFVRNAAWPQIWLQTKDEAKQQFTELRDMSGESMNHYIEALLKTSMSLKKLKKKTGREKERIRKAKKGRLCFIQL